MSQSDWRKDPNDVGQGEDTPAILLGDLRHQEGVELEVKANPELFDSDRYGEGVRVEAEYRDADVTFTTEDGDDIKQGDHVTLVSWSERLRAALTVAEQESGGDLPGSTIRVEKLTGRTSFDTDYTVDVVG